MNAQFDFSDKNVLIFGGTSGINLGIAEAFAASGANVGVVGRNPEKAQNARDTIAQHGQQAFCYTADVRDYEAVNQVYKSFRKDAGLIDVLVSGAAGNFPAPALGMSSNAFRSVMEIDLLGTFHVMRAGFEHLSAPGASVVNISAPQASIAIPLQSHVCSAKAGVDMITRTLAIEWGPMGVRVNSLVPGPIDGTEGMERLAPTEKMRAAVEKAVPLQRMGTPADVADVCLFLASDAARYVSGVVLAADGGAVAAGSAGMGMAAMHDS